MKVWQIWHEPTVNSDIYEATIQMYFMPHYSKQNNNINKQNNYEPPKSLMQFILKFKNEKKARQ